MSSGEILGLVLIQERLPSAETKVKICEKVNVQVLPALFRCAAVERVFDYTRWLGLGTLDCTLDSPVRHQPYESHQNINRLRQPLRPKRRNHRQDVEDRRHFSFPVSTDGLLEKRSRSIGGNDALLQQVVRNGRHEQDEPISR